MAIIVFLIFLCAFVVVYVCIEVHTSVRPYLYNHAIHLMSILFIVKDTDIRVEEHFGQQIGSTSSRQSRPQQSLRRTGSFGEVVIYVLCSKYCTFIPYHQASAADITIERRPQLRPRRQLRPRHQQRAGSMVDNLSSSYAIFFVIVIGGDKVGVQEYTTGD